MVRCARRELHVLTPCLQRTVSMRFARYYTYAVLYSLFGATIQQENTWVPVL